jgi:pyruvate dehydrogenase E1 component alpha subunit
MFEQFDPREGKRLQLLKEDGTLVNTGKGPLSRVPIMSDSDIKTAYEFMVKARIADEWAVSLNRQGRMPTYALNMGQEANSVAAMMALKKDDWLVVAFRELAGMLYRGYSLEKFYLYWFGDERGSQYDLKELYMTPINVPIASQLPHAVGLSYADKYRGDNRVTIAFVGDGGTSEGYFFEALNFAAVWKLPIIFYVQNNQWAISVPKSLQTTSNTYAEKAFACGMEGIQVDGNDPMAIYAATKMAEEKARSGGGPSLIEGYTYRLGPHTTADDPTRYREDSEVDEWRPKDPLVRTKKYLLNKKVISEKDVEELYAYNKQLVQTTFDAVEKSAPPTLEDGYKYIFEEMPWTLTEQMERRKNLQEEKL